MNHTIDTKHVKDTILAGTLERRIRPDEAVGALIASFNVQLHRRPSVEERKDLLEHIEQFLRRGDGL